MAPWHFLLLVMSLQCQSGLSDGDDPTSALEEEERRRTKEMEDYYYDGDDLVGTNSDISL